MYFLHTNNNILTDNYFLFSYNFKLHHFQNLLLNLMQYQLLYCDFNEVYCPDILIQN